MNFQSDNYSPNTQFSIFPPAVKHLLWINVLVFIATVNVFTSQFTNLGRTLFPYLALFPLQSGYFHVWQLVTYLFLHAGFTHILFNMFALWMFGQAIENYWGTKRFIIYYLLTGIGAGLLNLVFAGGGAPTIGASGAVYGILLAFGMMFPDRPIILLFPPIPVKAKYFVAFFGALELFNGVTGTAQGIAHFAHLGGMLVGFILIKYWGMKKEEAYY